MTSAAEELYISVMAGPGPDEPDPARAAGRRLAMRSVSPVRTSARTRTRAHGTYAHGTYVRTCTQVRSHTQTCTRTHARSHARSRRQAGTRARTHARTLTHTHAHTRARACACACVRACVCACACACACVHDLVRAGPAEPLLADGVLLCPLYYYKIIIYYYKIGWAEPLLADDVGGHGGPLGHTPPPAGPQQLGLRCPPLSPILL